jgi:hypothetical protein
MVEVQPPRLMDGQCYTFAEFRQVFDSIICTDGVVDRYGGDLLVTAVGGASVNVSVAAGSAWIDGSLNGAQGTYNVVNDAAKVMTIGANGAGADRIDLIVASIYDSQYIGAVDQWALEVVPGVAGGGVPAVPTTTRSGYIILGEVTVPASGATPSVVADVRTSMSTCGANPFVNLTASASTEVAAGGIETQLDLDTIVYVDPEFFDVTTTPNAVGILADGLYDITAEMQISTGGSGDLAGFIVYSGVNPIVGATSGTGGAGGGWAHQGTQQSWPLAAGEILDLWGSQSDGSPHDATFARLHIRKVG